MTLKDIIAKFGEHNQEKKAMMKLAEDKFRIQQMIEDRQKSANERELEKFMKEEREQQIKEELDFQRKKRQFDIDHNHNALDTPNITNNVAWHVLKEKNQFASKSNIFAGNPSVLKNNPHLLKSNKNLMKMEKDYD